MINVNAFEKINDDLPYRVGFKYAVYIGSFRVGVTYGAALFGVQSLPMLNGFALTFILKISVPEQTQSLSKGMLGGSELAIMKSNNHVKAVSKLFISLLAF